MRLSAERQIRRVEKINYSIGGGKKHTHLHPRWRLSDAVQRGKCHGSDITNEPTCDQVKGLLVLRVRSHLTGQQVQLCRGAINLKIERVCFEECKQISADFD